MSDTRPAKRLRTKTTVASSRPQPEPDLWIIKAVQLSGSELATVRVSPSITVKRLSEEIKCVTQTDHVLQFVFGGVVLQDQKSLVEAGLHNQASLEVVLVQDFFVAFGLKSGNVKIFSAQTGELRKTLQCRRIREHPPQSLHFRNSQNVTMICPDASGSFIYKQDLSSEGRMFLMQFGFDLASACLSQNGSLVAAGSFDGRVGVWSIDQMQLALEKDSRAVFLNPNLREWRASSADEVSLVALSPNGELVATNCLNEDSVVLWHTDTGKRARNIRKKHDRTGVCTFQFSPFGEVLAILTVDVSQTFVIIELWTIADGKRVKMLKGSRDADDTPRTPSMVFSPKGDALAVFAVPGIVDIFDLQQGSHKVVSLPYTTDTLLMAFSADGSLLATASFGAGKVAIWCATSWFIKRQFQVGASNQKLYTLAFAV